MFQPVSDTFLGLNKSYQTLLFQFFTQSRNIDRKSIIVESLDNCEIKMKEV